MLLLDWLLSADPAIIRLVKRDLFDEDVPYVSEGIINRYLSLFDERTNLWGGGVYGPKWISSTYTLLELIYLGVDPNLPVIQKGITHVIHVLWPHKGPYKNKRYLDMCIAGMLVHFASYANVEAEKCKEMIDYILDHTFVDGGWNCCFDSPTHHPKTSSLHTTINILEGLATYINHNNTYRIDEIKRQMTKANEFILQKNLFRSRRTGEVIHEDMKEFHYPTRWKYDAFRALEYFVNTKVTFDNRMNEAISIIKSAIVKHPMNKGKKYSGITHFVLEPYQYSKINTYRALKILKHYDVVFYQMIMKHQLDMNVL